MTSNFVKVILLSIALPLAACDAPLQNSGENSPAISDKQSTLVESEFFSGSLAGRYLNAGENSPVVLIVPGSGPTDLDGNSPNGINTNMYKYLAEGLAENGVSSVRVDKHGMFSSNGSGDANNVTLKSYSLNYRGWARTIKHHTNQDCIYMLGHSEGGTMVSAASIDNPNVCGVVLLAAPGRPLGVILQEQLKANKANGPLLPVAFDAISKLERGEAVDFEDMNPALRPLFAPQVQNFLISIISEDPSEIIKSANKPTLVIHGTTDIQVAEKDAELLAKASGGELVLIEGVNHVMKEASKNRILNTMTYKNPNLPISLEAVEVISKFVKN